MNRIRGKKGFLLLELLLAMVLLAFFTLSIMSANLSVLRSRAANKSRMIATEIAARTLEQYAALNPINLSSANDFIDSVEQSGFTFSRSVTVSILADQSRQVVVSVANAGGNEATTVSLSGVYSMWGSL